MLLIDGPILRTESVYDAESAAQNKWAAASNDDKHGMIIDEAKALPLRYRTIQYLREQLEKRRYSMPEGKVLQASAWLDNAEDQLTTVARMYYNSLPLANRLLINWGLTGLGRSWMEVLGSIATEFVKVTAGVAILSGAIGVAVGVGLPAALVALAGMVVASIISVFNGQPAQIDAAGNPIETPLQTVAKSTKGIVVALVAGAVLIGGGALYAKSKGLFS